MEAALLSLGSFLFVVCLFVGFANETRLPYGGRNTAAKSA
jgi:hypothetical protein